MHLCSAGAPTSPHLAFLTLIGGWDARGSHTGNEDPVLSGVTLRVPSVCQGTTSEGDSAGSLTGTAVPTRGVLGLPCTRGDWQVMLLIVGMP